MSQPTPSHRLKRFGPHLRLIVALTAAAGLIAVITTAGAARVESDVHRSDRDAVIETELAALDDEARAREATWTLATAPLERIGYRQGRRGAIEVVPLGPSAVEVEVSTARTFLAMRAAAAADGVELRLASGFRTGAQQRELYRAWKTGQGNKAARPGRSNHQSGRALDIAVNSVPGALAWLEANAATYGFKRTIASEPWHWEYVEIPIARGKTRYAKRGKHAKHAKLVKHAKRAKAATRTRRTAAR